LNRTGLGYKLLALALVALAISWVLSDKPQSLRQRLPLGRARIAVVPLYGEIMDPSPVIRLLRRYHDDIAGVKAIVLAIDSPGGDVAASQEISDCIREIQNDGIPVIAALGSIAASGGYYVAAPARRIVANAGTLTGSIGVIFEAPYFGGLLQKVGVDLQVVKSGEFKDMGNPARRMGAGERRRFQEVIDDVYDQFLQEVLAGRKEALTQQLSLKRGIKAGKISHEELTAYLRSFADGRVFSGRQAMDYGLVDALGGLDEAIRVAADTAQIEDYDVITHRPSRSLAEWLTGMSKAELKGELHEALGMKARRFGFFAW